MKRGADFYDRPLAWVFFTRDTQDRITRITDPMNRHLDYGYDANGDLISYTNATSDTTTFSYGTQHDLLEIHDPNRLRDAFRVRRCGPPDARARRAHARDDNDLR
jgi:YD repeat-containing protein